MCCGRHGYLVGGLQPAVVSDVLAQGVLPVQRLLVDAVVTVLIHLGGDGEMTTFI